MENSSRKFKSLPDTSGIYQFIDKEKKIIYIGKAKSLKKRVSSYFQNKKLGPKTNLMVKKTSDIQYIKVFSEFEAILLEAELIKKHQPFFNTIAKDDKSPLYIKINNEQVPLVTLSRKKKTTPGLFLKGPFESTKIAKDILKVVRKIFPYCHHKSFKKPCLFVHLGLCLYPYQSEDAKIQYLKNIKEIKKLLSGQSKLVVKNLNREMQNLSVLQKFEEAGNIKKKIQKLEFLTTTYHTPQEFLRRPTLVDDLTKSKLTNLQKVLQLKRLPKRIECYDISSIGGKLATGAMVVFENGLPQKSQYRRFKIKFTHKADDYQMIREILTRRFNNHWPHPDLIIIDGGCGQLNAALSVTSRFNISLPLISLAKKFEEIYTPDKVMPISLSIRSGARLLVQEIRDEAHRFAIIYHKHLRSKKLFT